MCDSSVKVGSLGTLRFPSGLYAYVGSARGPGGVAVRVSRHLRREKALHWHIDYLTSQRCSRPHLAVTAECLFDAEERLSAELENSACLSPSHAGFGSSDKRSRTHLFHCECSAEACAREVLNAVSRLGLQGNVHIFSH